MNTTTLADIDNALVDQKDSILLALGSGQDAENIEKAANLLPCASPLSYACGYGYKTSQLRDRIISSIDSQLAAENEWLVGLRKNDTTRRITELTIHKLSNRRNIIAK